MTVVAVTPVAPTPIGVSRAGPAGKGWVFGEGPPTDDLGRIGEMYLDIDPEGLFDAYGPKPGATWIGAQVYPLGAESAGAIAAKDSAEAAADLAEGHAASAASDKAAVAADRVQTALDRAAVAAAEAAVASDKADAVSAAGDAAGSAVATAADRSVVASDRMAVAGHAAQVALDRAAVETAADAADADATQTAADRVQTGLDRAAAEAAAAAAATFDPTAYYDKTASDERFATSAQGALADSAVQPNDLGTAAAADTGVAAGNVVVLDGSAKLPAVDGSQLTNLPGGGSFASITSAASPYAATDDEVIQCTSGAITVNLPASPGDGDTVVVIRDGSGNVTVDPGSNTITGAAPDFIIDVDKRVATFTYSGVTWVVAGGRIA